MKARPLASLLIAAVASSWVLLTAPVPAASADPCPDVEVVFARGTDEPPGLGDVGESFVDMLRTHVGPKSLEVYPVNYPATTNFPTAIDGITDAGARVEQIATACPKTQMVLGGYSQGAAVMGFVTANQVPDGARLVQDVKPMPPEIANHVAAVTLFGKPSSQFMNFINEPPVTVGPLYAPKTIELCVPNDPICAGSGDFSAHKQYVEAGLVDQAANFTTTHLVETPPPNGPSATPSPSPVPAHSPGPAASPTPTPAASHSPGPPPGPAA
jgi:cutinase